MRFAGIVALLVVGLLPSGRATGAEKAQKVVLEWAWDKLAPGSLPAGAALVGPGDGADFARVRVANPSSGPASFTIATLHRPPITGWQYAVRGRVRYEGVEGVGYLEMWNHFPPADRYFTRTLANDGPLKHLTGSSPWRAFELPFSSQPEMPRPDRLVINVVLPGRGTVEVGPLTLVEQPGGWWTPSQAAYASGLAGLLGGLAGALLGLLAGLGKARRFALPLAVALAAAGLGAVCLGLYALRTDQPDEVTVPPLLGGAVAAIVFGSAAPAIRALYRQLDLRRMKALDA